MLLIYAKKRLATDFIVNLPHGGLIFPRWCDSGSAWPHYTRSRSSCSNLTHPRALAPPPPLERKERGVRLQMPRRFFFLFIFIYFRGTGYYIRSSVASSAGVSTYFCFEVFVNMAFVCNKTSMGTSRNQTLLLTFYVNK